MDTQDRIRALEARAAHNQIYDGHNPVRCRLTVEKMTDPKLTAADTLVISTILALNGLRALAPADRQPALLGLMSIIGTGMRDAEAEEALLRSAH